jgi:hypothetical protein
MSGGHDREKDVEAGSSGRVGKSELQEKGKKKVGGTGANQKYLTVQASG